jgi:hypothetical protein
MQASFSRLVEYIMQSHNATEHQIKSKKHVSAGGKTNQYLEPFRTDQYQVPKCKHIEKQTNSSIM